MTADVARTIYGRATRREARLARLHSHLQGKAGVAARGAFAAFERKMARRGRHGKAIHLPPQVKTYFDATGTVGGIASVAPRAPGIVMPYAEPHLAELFGGYDDPGMAGFFSKIGKGLKKVVSSKAFKYAAIAAATYYSGGLATKAAGKFLGGSAGNLKSLIPIAKSAFAAKAAPPLPGSVASPYGLGPTSPFDGSPYGGGGSSSYGGGGFSPSYGGGPSLTDDSGYDGSYGMPDSTGRSSRSRLSEASMFGGEGGSPLLYLALAGGALFVLSRTKARRSRRR